MALKVDIDLNSGFCGGVIRAIRKAESFIDSNGGSKLYSLGSIVHNEAELARLEKKGLETVDKSKFKELAGKTVLIRAHGEPPETYRLAKEKEINLIDCTCPVVLQIQKRMKEAYFRLNSGRRRGQIIIFGKTGHAEVLGLIGQVEGDALIIENLPMLLEAVSKGKIAVNGPIEIFSQTTKSLAEYASLCAELEEIMAKANELSVERFRGTGLLTVHNTVCTQVSSRYEELSKFASSHDIVVFVSGKESSNGKVLYELCLSVNKSTYMVGSNEDVKASWFKDGDSVGVCGATSTPKWQLEQVAEYISLIEL